MKYFSPLMAANGHPPAFGFKVPYPEWIYFKHIVAGIGERTKNIVRPPNKTVNMMYGFDKALAESIAYENEFVPKDKSPTYIKYFLNKIVEGDKYGYAYLIWGNGIETIWCPSDKRILSPCEVLLYPYLQKKLKLKAVWE
ncbi:hypothetical protein AGMMS49975_10140 [Clostridia bacterium]|nr:hypothetical protein AGMMS49975_10140 [Clostridia bacterium]